MKWVLTFLNQMNLVFYDKVVKKVICCGNWKVEILIKVSNACLFAHKRGITLFSFLFPHATYQ